MTAQRPRRCSGMAARSAQESRCVNIAPGARRENKRPRDSLGEKPMSYRSRNRVRARQRHAIREPREGDPFAKGAFAGAIPAKESLRRRLITFQWRCGEGGRRSALTVTPIVARCLARSARGLFRGAENGGAGLRYARIGRLAARHHRPAAFFDIRRLLP
jgi:hypothetical protein